MKTAQELVDRFKKKWLSAFSEIFFINSIIYELWRYIFLLNMSETSLGISSMKWDHNTCSWCQWNIILALEAAYEVLWRTLNLFVVITAIVIKVCVYMNIYVPFNPTIYVYVYVCMYVLRRTLLGPVTFTSPAQNMFWAQVVLESSVEPNLNCQNHCSCGFQRFWNHRFFVKTFFILMVI